MKKYLLKPKAEDTFRCVFRDKEVVFVGPNKLIREVKKDLETYVYRGNISLARGKDYPKELKDNVNVIIRAYHKPYKEIYDKCLDVENRYAKCNPEEEEELEKEATKYQMEKNQMYEDKILVMFDKLIKEER